MFRRAVVAWGGNASGKGATTTPSTTSHGRLTVTNKKKQERAPGREQTG